MKITFVETAVFTHRIERLGLEDELRALQLELLKNPRAGRIDPGTGGLRKVRVSMGGRGKGKRSGARVHYLHLPHAHRAYLIFVYGKDESNTLTSKQKAQLRLIVDEIKREVRNMRQVQPSLS